MIYFPGNSLNRHQQIQDLHEVANCGHDVLIFDYANERHSVTQGQGSFSMKFSRYAKAPREVQLAALYGKNR